MAAKTSRILITGDVRGCINALNERVKGIVTKNGPFDMILCTGDFFGDTAGNEEVSDNVDALEVAAFLKNGKQFEIPLYFIGSGSLCELVATLLEEYPKSNIHYLGQQGMTKIAGLTVAFFDDLIIEEGSMEMFAKRVENLEGDVDLLLTSTWPTGVLKHTKDEPKLANMASSRESAKIAQMVRPRYHIAANNGTFYSRAPYANRDLGTGSHVTRFIALGEVSNNKKEKFIHALGLTPAMLMSRDAFFTHPSDTTPYPYESTERAKRPLEPGQENWRWANMDKKPRGQSFVVKDNRKSIFVRNILYRANDDDLVDFFSSCGKVVDVRRGRDAQGNTKGYAHIQFASIEEMTKGCKLNEKELMGRPLYISPAESRQKPKNSHPIADCWFCLSNPNADVHLVASVGRECYCALDKGPISSFHVLVVPIDHVQCTIVLNDTTYAEVIKYFEALKTCFAVRGMETLIFERYLRLRGREGGNHCHFNVVGIRKDDVMNIRSNFMQEAKFHGFNFEDVDTNSAFDDNDFRTKLRDVVGDMEYIMILLPDGSVIAHPIMRGERIPYNFVRDVIARAIGAPERGDWKACKMTQEEEVQSVTKFKTIFEQHDIMS